MIGDEDEMHLCSEGEMRAVGRRGSGGVGGETRRAQGVEKAWWRLLCVWSGCIAAQGQQALDIKMCTVEVKSEVNAKLSRNSYRLRSW
jgi:hypothetical protein